MAEQTVSVCGKVFLRSVSVNWADYASHHGSACQVDSANSIVQALPCSWSEQHTAVIQWNGYSTIRLGDIYRRGGIGQHDYLLGGRATGSRSHYIAVET